MIFQAMYMADTEPLDAFQNAVQDRLDQSYSTVRSQDYIFEIMPQGATKASGLKHLAEKLGIAPDQIMALGDAANDLEMLQFVGQSVAMGNASDDIKELCKYVTLTNDEAGVATLFVLGLYKKKTFSFYLLKFFRFRIMAMRVVSVIVTSVMAAG